MFDIGDLVSVRTPDTVFTGVYEIVIKDFQFISKTRYNKLDDEDKEKFTVYVLRQLHGKKMTRHFYGGSLTLVRKCPFRKLNDILDELVNEVIS